MWSSQSLPLQDIKSYHPSFRVESRLHENLWKHPFTENDITLELFSLCCQLEFLCKRHYTKVKGGIHDSHKLEYENKFKPHARVEFLKMNELLMYLPSPQPTFQEFLKKKKMDKLFPRLWSYFQNPRKPNFHVQKSVISDYFGRLSSLNQLKMMSQQINLDIHHLANHKYMAHQTALLYHAIAEIGSPLEGYKNQVEEMFGKIKKSLAVESGQIPHLSMEDKLRLDTVTSSLMEHVHGFREDLIEPMTSVISFIQEYA